MHQLQVTAEYSALTAYLYLIHHRTTSKRSDPSAAPAQLSDLDSPKPCMEHGHPGSSAESVSRGVERKVLLDGHVANERQDEQRHAEHDEPQRAGYAHHPASLRAPAPLSPGPQDH